MNTRPSIQIRKIILVGRRKNYEVNFFPGVNIIYGDSSTGKSSILEIINYLFGSSEFIYDHEIETSVVYAAMEVLLSGHVYVIKRDIFDSSKLVEVYPSAFDEIDSVFPKKLSPNYRSAGPDGYLSDFLLSSLNLPILKVLEAPSKADSQLVRLSFRDLFKFCYLKQDDVGSKQLLGFGNWVVYNKNKQTFKYVFNLLDSHISELELQLSNLHNDRKRLDGKYQAVSEFLRETEFESAIGLTDSIEELQRQEQTLKDQLSEINKSMTADSETYSFLRDSLSELSGDIKLTLNDRTNCELAIERYSRLKNDYQTDISKLKAIKTAKDQIGELPSELFNCPICDNHLSLDSIKHEHTIDESDKVNQEVNVLTRRIRDLDSLLVTERGKHHSLSLKIKSLYQDQEKLRRILDEESATMITPYLSERDGISKELATVKEKENQLNNSLRIRNQQRNIFDELDRLISRIEVLQKDLDKLRLSAPSISEVLSKLGDSLNRYLTKVNIKDRRDVRITPSSYLPELRNREYKDITSGGLRTILSIGYLISLFESALEDSVNLPAFLMIDTVGKYLGKTQEKYTETDTNADSNENISDPSKYHNMYEYMIDVAEKAEEKNVTCQIILVDNDVPIGIQEKYAGFVIAHYSNSGRNGLPVGLIDDAVSV